MISMSKVSDHFKQQRSGRVAVGKKAEPAAAEAVPSAAAAFDTQQAEQAEATLRQFDLSSKYGPCMGVTRLERYERAVKLGLDPPAEVKELILRYGLESRHNINVFHHPF